jgi:hypothetical protein
MQEIKCPHCGQVFTVDESGYQQIVSQVRDKEFHKELERREQEQGIHHVPGDARLGRVDTREVEDLVLVNHQLQVPQEQRELLVGELDVIGGKLVGELFSVRHGETSNLVGRV